MLKPSLMLAGIVVAAIGVALLGLGPQLGVERPEPLGICVFGVGFALMGLDGLVTGKIEYGDEDRTFYVFGVVARLRGLAGALSGLGIATISLFELVRHGSFEEFARQPLGQGTILIGLGLLGLVFAASVVISRERIVGNHALSLLISLQARIVGLALMLVSLAMIVAGTLRIVAPATLDSLFENLMRSLSGSS